MLLTSAESLASYAPARLVRRAVETPETLQAPAMEIFPAAALFADLSGFTALSERLAAQGPVGIEKLTRILNDYFGRLIDLIYAHGGDAVKFAGDSLLAVWEADNQHEALQNATHLAAQCGLAVQSELHDYTAENARLALRISIGAGQAMGMVLGGVRSRQEYLLAGWPVVQAALADASARPGDVTLSPEARVLLEERAVGSVLPSHGLRLSSLRFGLPCPSPRSPVLSPECETAPLAVYSPFGAFPSRGRA